MAEAQRITDPNLLGNLVAELSSLTIGASKPQEIGSPTREVTLVLLQPLSNAKMLAACRNTSLRSNQKSNSAAARPSKYEYLDVGPLSKAWRQALMKVAPISKLTFDLTLPQPGEESTSVFETVYWDVALPEEGGLAVRTQDVMNIAITIATEMRMRIDGNLQLGLTYGEAEGASARGMALLKKQLLALAEFKTQAKGDEQNEERKEE